MKNNRLIIFAMISILFACNADVKDISVKGTVFNADDNEPINDVIVKVTCWKYGYSPDESYAENEVKVVKTDEDGQYEVEFDKGARIDVEVSITGYFDGYEYINMVYNKDITLNVALRPMNLARRYYIDWNLETEVEGWGELNLARLITEVREDGVVLKEIGVSNDGQITHVFPSGVSKYGNYGLWDNVKISNAFLRNDLTETEFLSIWNRANK